MNKSEFINRYKAGMITPDSEITITAKTMVMLLEQQNKHTYVSVHNILANMSVNEENGITDFNKQQFMQSEIRTPVLVDPMELRALFNEIDRSKCKLEKTKETIVNNNKLIQLLVDKVNNKPPRVDIYT